MEGSLIRKIGYGRVSTTDQTTAVQEASLKEAGCELVFVEKISSRAPVEKRLMLMKALEELRRGDVLVVAKLDRLGRSQAEVIARLNTLTEEGIYLETLDGMLNTKALGKMTPLIVGLLTGLAEVERSLIQERTKESIEFRRKTGGNLGGRPPLPDSRRSLVLRLRNEGKTYREISESTGCALSTAHKICLDEAA